MVITLITLKNYLRKEPYKISFIYSVYLPQLSLVRNMDVRVEEIDNWSYVRLFILSLVQLFPNETFKESKLYSLNKTLYSLY